MQNHFNPVPTPRFARLLAQQRGITKGPSSCIASFVGAHSGSDLFGNLLLEVKVELGIETLHFPSAVEKHFQPHADLFQPAHDPLLFRLGLLNDQIDRSGEPVPVCGFLFQLLTAGRRQPVELRLPSRVTLLPFPAYPSLLL